MDADSIYDLGNEHASTEHGNTVGFTIRVDVDILRRSAKLTGRTTKWRLVRKNSNPRNRVPAAPVIAASIRLR